MVNMISESLADKLELDVVIDPVGYEYVTRADGSPVPNVVGLTDTHIMYNDQPLWFDGVVGKDLEFDVVGGVPFMEANDIAVRPATAKRNCAGYPAP